MFESGSILMPLEYIIKKKKMIYIIQLSTGAATLTVDSEKPHLYFIQFLIVLGLRTELCIEDHSFVFI